MKKLLCLTVALALLCLGLPIALAESEPPLEIRMTVRLFDQVPDMTNQYWTKYQEATNTKLDVEWIPDGDYATKLNLILASGELPEVLVANCSNNLNNSAFINAVQNGAFWDLTDILGDFSNYPNLRDNVAPNAWVTSRVLGRIYGIPQSVSTVSGSPIIRQDLLDDLGLSMPANMDEFITTLKKVVDANPGMIGLVSKQDVFINSDGGLAVAFGNNLPYYDEAGGLVYRKLAPSFTKFVSWMREAYEAGILSEEFAVMAPTQATELFSSGNAACLINESMRWCYPFSQTLQTVKTGAIAQCIPPMLGSEGNYSVSAGTGVVDSMFISSKVPKEKVLKILEYFEKTTTQKFYDITTYGFEGIHYTLDASGYKVPTEQRNKDMGSSAPWQVLPLMYNRYMKTDSTAAPAEYNMKQREYINSWGFFEKGQVDPFAVATSETWISIWPRYVNDWASTAVKAVIGQITMEEYEAYVDNLNQNPEIKTAYQEFAKSYQAVYGK